MWIHTFTFRRLNDLREDKSCAVAGKDHRHVIKPIRMLSTWKIIWDSSEMGTKFAVVDRLLSLNPERGYAAVRSDSFLSTGLQFLTYSAHHSAAAGPRPNTLHNGQMSVPCWQRGQERGGLWCTINDGGLLQLILAGHKSTIVSLQKNPKENHLKQGLEVKGTVTSYWICQAVWRQAGRPPWGEGCRLQGHAGRKARPGRRDLPGTPLPQCFRTPGAKHTLRLVIRSEPNYRWDVRRQRFSCERQSNAARHARPAIYISRVQYMCYCVSQCKDSIGEEHTDVCVCSNKEPLSWYITI